MMSEEGSSEKYTRLSGTKYSYEEMKQISALVVGVGAVGNEVVKHLALMGVGRIFVLDFDDFEIHNMTRSVMLASAPAERLTTSPEKVLVARDVVEAWNEDVSVIPLNYRVEQLDLGPFLQSDIVFSCVDTIAARVYVAIQSVRAGVPLVEGGMAADYERFDLIATNAVAGPCGSNCLDPKFRARANNLIEASFYNHEGCQVIAQEFEQSESVPTISLVSSILAAQEVALGLQMVRDQKRGEVQEVGCRLSMSVRAKGEQQFRQTFFKKCEESDGEVRLDRKCLLSSARVVGQWANLARKNPITVLDIAAGEASLEDVLDAGARELGIKPDDAEVWVDQMFTPGFECKSCGHTTEQATLMHKAYATTCCEAPNISIKRRIAIYGHHEPPGVQQSIQGTTIDQMGYQDHPGWVVRAAGLEAERPALRVVLKDGVLDRRTDQDGASRPQ